MNLIPIQIIDEGVLIPKSYLQNADAVDVVITEHYVLVKPKRQPTPELPLPTVVQAPPTPPQPARPRPVDSPRQDTVVQTPSTPPQPARPVRRNPLLAGVRSPNQAAVAGPEPMLEHEADQRFFTLVNMKPGRDFELLS